MQRTLVTVLTFAFVVNYLDVVHCDGDGAPSAPVKSPDQQPAAPAASDSPAAPAAASAKLDSPATTKSTARPKPPKRAQRPAYPARSPPRVRSPHAPTHPRKY
ncbi:hypothetical protein MS3_00000917 [Schistosoma haematobium]|uniref:MEG-7 n=1 Tax=Schistosoma haematobium TaxID=6185 RepID=A0A922LYY6_SCHHA|nr:hypothetical protein MS3_00000917 [Schistosoma haematobium]KAH9596391.1 hypothetical protein MS3_00000917 [Schistosoma haematobium]